MKKTSTFIVLLVATALMQINQLYAQSTPPENTPVISLTTAVNATVSISIKAHSSNTPVWIETSPGVFDDFSINAFWTGYKPFTVNGNKLNIYGDLYGFDCTSQTHNGPVLAIDLSLAPNLDQLYCSNNQISNLDVSYIKSLSILQCYHNIISSLNLNGLTNLFELFCFENRLQTLDVSTLSALQDIRCFTNFLTELNLSGLSEMKKVYCHGNNLNTQAIDHIFCALPQRTYSEYAFI